jgi:predicted dehydrogenase/threonine dehydrogenase-like Zn-dependent dehydrogenase
MGDTPMRQVLQDLGKGDTLLIDAPAPSASPGSVIVHSTASLISAGTERMLVDFGKASMLNKARQQPERVKMVLEKVRTDGLLTTIDAVRSKLGQPLPLGYSNVGVVAATGSGVDEFVPGDRVVSNGAHADVVKVPKNLCAKIPDNVGDHEAAFTVVASIGLQGIRLAQPSLGESFVVVGTGLIGLLAVQLLRAHGCRVLAIDFDEGKLKLAQSFGAEICNPAKGEDPVASGMAFSRGNGVDGVIITASTDSNEPVTNAAKMCRKRGRIVLVGVTGLQLNRADFYEKELSFQVSCSYGPGRYDPQYENQGVDYPFGFVRWTEKRNFEAVLDMMSSGRIDVRPLMSRRFDFNDVASAYRTLSEDKSALGILLDYNATPAERDVKEVKLSAVPSHTANKPALGFIGAGNYASRVLIPAFKAAGAQLRSIVTENGVSGAVQGKKAGFALATTDVEAMLKDPATNTVVIATRHDSHASLTARALRAGKDVFVEKPLALTQAEVDEVDAAREAGGQRRLMVGFNRRFAPHVVRMKSLLSPVQEPKVFVVTVNAGAIPSGHWTQDPAIGGGRVIGEACHFIDLIRFLGGAAISSVQARRIGNAPGVEIAEDKASITLSLADGSLGTIHYLANGSAQFPKERIEVFTAGRVLQIDNFRSMRGFGWPGFKKMNLWRQDKGQQACAAAFLAAIETGSASPIAYDEIIEVSRATIEAGEQLRRA